MSDGISGFFHTIKDDFVKTGETIKDSGKDFGKETHKFGTDSAHMGKDIVGGVKNLGKGFGDVLTGHFKEAGQQVHVHQNIDKIQHGIKDGLHALGEQGKHLGKDLYGIGKNDVELFKNIGQGVGDVFTGHFHEAGQHFIGAGKNVVGAIGDGFDVATSLVKDVVVDSPVGLLVDHTAMGQDLMGMRAAIGRGVMAVGTEVAHVTPLGLVDTAAEQGAFGKAGEKVAGFGNGIFNGLITDPATQMLTSTNLGDAAVGAAELATLAVPGGGEAAAGVEAVAKVGEVASDGAKVAQDAAVAEAAGSKTFSGADGDAAIAEAERSKTFSGADGDAAIFSAANGDAAVTEAAVPKTYSAADWDAAVTEAAGSKPFSVADGDAANVSAAKGDAAVGESAAPKTYSAADWDATFEKDAVPYAAGHVAASAA